MPIKPDCPKCHGTGRVPAETKPPHPPSFTRCVCVLHEDIMLNVERGMKGLSGAAPIETSVLTDKHDTNLLITANSRWMLRNLRHVAIRMPPTWFFKVVSDADLVTAWLSSTAIKGIEIFDADAFAVSTKYLSIPDLVMPPDLLIVRMGVKAARNSASPEVLAEALNTRRHAERPVWVWDEPNHPLGPGHMFWSDAVETSLLGYARIDGSRNQVQEARPTSSSPTASPKQPTSKTSRAPRLGTGSRKSLRGGDK